jgi:uncharacterized protein (TIGR01777 family)
MRFFVTGASGLIGKRLLRELSEAGHSINALSRRSHPDEGNVHWIAGDPVRPGDWTRAVDGCDAVIHLAGEPIADKRWSPEQKRRLVDSRVKSGHLLASAIARADAPPPVLVSASAVGYYGARGDEELTEQSGPGDDFLARVCVDWETAARKAASPTTRVTVVRIGIALDPDGGALEKMIPPFRLGLGGPIGPSGRWFPWVHAADVVGILRHATENPGPGVLNAVGPEPKTMGEFASALGRAMGRPAILPIPIAPLRLVLGEFAGHLSPGQKVVPAATLASGYSFRFPTLAGALADCVRR